MKWIKRIGIAVAIFTVLSYVIASVYLASSIVRPQTLTLAQEETWEKEHGMWRDFDTYEKSHYTVNASHGYQLHVTWVKAANPSSDKYVIITHGFRSNRHGAMKYVESYRRLGYHTILYDVRGHGDNAPSTVTLGKQEAMDLMALIDDTYKRYGQAIYLGLHGESMGSSITLHALQYHPHVQFVVADSGFTNLYQLLQEGYEANHLSLLLPGVNWAAKVIYGVDMAQTSAIDAVKSNSTIPVTFVHGGSDRFIFPKHSQLLADANETEDNVFIVDGAKHAESREILGVERYTELLQQNPNVK